MTLRDQLYRMELDELVDIARIVGQNEDITMFVVYDKRGVILVDNNQPELVYSQTVDVLGAKLVGLESGQTYLDWQETQLVSGRAVVLGNQAYGAVAIGLSTEPGKQRIAALTQQSFLLALLILVFGLGLTILFARQITNPLSELAEGATQMAGGNLSMRVNVKSGDEIGQLGEAFNQMADAIEHRDRELRELAAGLELTVDERTAELREQNVVLEQMAITDPLTKIYNRRFFFELAEKEYKRAARFGHPLSVAIIDIDHFKKVNDTYGHQVGDQTLINFTKFCLENIRSVDIFARYGGEEFVILMPETESQAAQNSAERLQKLVQQTPMTPGEQQILITISLGIACWDGKQELTFDALLVRADRALYQSKEQGRNRVSVWQENGSPVSRA